jgi:hypothetical protein
MSNQHHAESNEVTLLSRIAHVTGRAGLAMAGAMCGTFVAAQLASVDGELFDSVAFIALMTVLGTLAFYLGIDIPRQTRPHRGFEPTGTGQIEILSAIGTFLAAFSALVSVYAFIFDEKLRGWGELLGFSWMLGIAMLISAGVIARRRPRAVPEYGRRPTRLAEIIRKQKATGSVL